MPRHFFMLFIRLSAPLQMKSSYPCVNSIAACKVTLCLFFPGLMWLQDHLGRGCLLVLGLLFRESILIVSLIAYGFCLVIVKWQRDQSGKQWLMPLIISSVI